MTHRTVVTGLGALTPIGLTPEAFWQGMMNGTSGAGPITRFDTALYKTQFACELQGFDPRDYMDRKLASRLDPFCQYALAATRQALDDAALDPSTFSAAQQERAGVVFGTGVGGLDLLLEQTKVLLERGPDRVSPFFVPMMIGNMAAGIIAMEYKLRGPNHGVVSACATSNHSIGDALMQLRHGHADVMLCGGSEAPITPIAIAGYQAMRALSTRNDDPATASRPFDRDRDGFVAGEGGAVLVLETLEHAEARGADIYAEVAGFGASSDAHHYAAPDPEGYGMCLAMRHAIDDAGVRAADVDYINMHATSTPLGDRAETIAIKKALGDRAHKIPLSATKSMIGHLQGAAGAVEAVATILAIRHGTIPPTINVKTLDPECDLDYTLDQPREHDVRVALSNAFGFGGHNTTVAFRRFES